MGKPLTEQQKAHRAALAIKRKARAELGPLFGDQAPEVDERALMVERRMGFARNVEYNEAGHTAPAIAFLEYSEYRSLVVIARRHLPADVVEKLDAYARKTYPCVSYWHSFWLDVLSGRERVPGKRRLTFDPALVTQYNPDGRRVVVDDWLPDESWRPPYDAEWRRTYFWFRCDKCKRWHAPAQPDCYPALPEETPALNLFATARAQ